MTRPMPVGSIAIAAAVVLFGMTFSGASGAGTITVEMLADGCEIEGDGTCFFTCDAGEFIRARSYNGPVATIAECGGTAIAAVSFFADRDNKSPAPAKISASGTCIHIGGGGGDGECYTEA